MGSYTRCSLSWGWLLYNSGVEVDRSTEARRTQSALALWDKARTADSRAASADLRAMHRRAVEEK